MFELFLSFDSYGRLDFRIKMISHQTKSIILLFRNQFTSVHMSISDHFYVNDA
jgi:hypothetical protein